MSQNELDRFISDMGQDPQLAQEFRRLAADLEAAICWANARGYDFSLQEARRLDRLGELSDDDLDMVAGGWSATDPPPTGTGG